MHHYECVAPNVDVNLQSGQFWVTLVASFRERLIDFRSCWVIFIHVVQGRPGSLLQFSKSEAVKIWFIWHLRSVAEQVEMPCLNSSRKMWLLCFASHIIIPSNLLQGSALSTQWVHHPSPVDLFSGLDICGNLWFWYSYNKVISFINDVQDSLLLFLLKWSLINCKFCLRVFLSLSDFFT